MGVFEKVNRHDLPGDELKKDATNTYIVDFPNIFFSICNLFFSFMLACSIELSHLRTSISIISMFESENVYVFECFSLHTI
jgi:hypothetical protein